MLYAVQVGALKLVTWMQKKKKGKEESGQSDTRTFCELQWPCETRRAEVANVSHGLLPRGHHAAA